MSHRTVRQSAAHRGGAGASNFILNGSPLQKQGVLWEAIHLMGVLAPKSQRAKQQKYAGVSSTESFQGRELWANTSEGAHQLPHFIFTEQNPQTSQHEQIASLLVHYDFIQWGICRIHSTNMYSTLVLIGNSYRTAWEPCFPRPVPSTWGFRLKAPQGQR